MLLNTHSLKTGILLMKINKNAPDLQFERIYRDHYKRVYSFLYKLCRSPETAEDLTQETFYQAYISLNRFDGSCELYTWLISIAKNLFFKYLRKTKNDHLTIDLYITDLEAPLSDEPGYRLIREVEIEDVRRAIDAMPKKYSEVLIMRIYAELPYEEISRKLGISVNSAKVIFHRAKNFVKKALLA